MAGASVPSLDAPAIVAPRVVRRDSPWRGVSLGGWLLLEPGPSRDLFRAYRKPVPAVAAATQASLAATSTSSTATLAQVAAAPSRPKDGDVASCEWELMEILRERDAVSALHEHRETFITRKDLEVIKCLGLNAVRIPFGYWVVLGPLAAREPYEGPAMEYLDRAVSWCEELGLQVLLDLHGAPGGESAEAPCGRKQRGRNRWTWRQWRFSESLRALDIVSRRYASSPAVTGIAVCNEPSPSVPTKSLCRYYCKALEVVRDAGLHHDKVSVVLPVFQRNLRDFVQRWEVAARIAQRAGAVHGDVCFEVHWYHCFENAWHGRTFAQHLRAVQEHARQLRNYPIVVGEWSLALGRGAQPGLLSRAEMSRLFAHAQLAAYREASHGWFFWTWSDRGGGPAWDWQISHAQGCWPQDLDFPSGTGLREPPARQPAAGCDRDPLERVLDVPASDPFIRLGDTVYLRSFNGTYFDVEGERVRSRYGDRGRWQQFVICPASRATTASWSPSTDSDVLRDGDAICLLSHTGRFIGVCDCEVSARWSAMEASDGSCVLIIRVEGAGVRAKVRHNRAIFLQCDKSGKALAPNEGDPDRRTDVAAKWPHLSDWQRLIIEKPLSTAVTPRRPRRRSVDQLPMPALALPSSRAQSLDDKAQSSSVRRVASPNRLVGRKSAESLGAERSSSIGLRIVSADEPPGTPTRKRRTTLTHQKSMDMPNFAFALPTPSRRRWPATPATDAPMSPKKATSAAPCPASTPCRRRRSTDAQELEELANLTTPSRRRRISGSGTEGLLSLLMEPSPSPAALAPPLPSGSSSSAPLGLAKLMSPTLLMPQFVDA